MSTLFGIIGEYNHTQANQAFATLSHSPNSLHVEKEQLFLTCNYVYKKIYLSFDGEILNAQELQNTLSINSPIIEIYSLLTKAYLAWGEEFVRHLRGTFSIAIFDDETLYLFRDTLGKEPLFYLQSDSFVFSSKLKAITPFLKKKEMDDDALLSYLTFLAPTPPFTFFKGVKKLAAGEYLIYKNQKVQIKKHYDILHVRANLISNKDEAIAKLQAVLEESMELHLSKKIPMASLLSGGIDSATINYYAKKQGLNLPTYTLGYAEYAKYDERASAKNSAEFLGVSNKEVVINQKSFIDASEKLLFAMDEPLNDPAAIPLYLLFEEIKKDGFLHVMSGEGSDELFLGYRQYFEYLDIESASTLAHKNWLKKYFRANFSMNREWEWYKRVFDETLLFRTSGEKFTDLQKNKLMRRNVKDNESLKYIQNLRDSFLSSAHTDESIWYSYADLNIFQAEHFLSKLSSVGAMHSLSSSTPFLDTKLVETVFSLTPKLRYEDGITKSLLKKIMKDKLSDEILSRKKKGFANPYMEYLINSGKINLIQEVNQETGMFHKERLNEYIQTASNGSFKQHIWGLYVLSHWIKRELL